MHIKEYAAANDFVTGLALGLHMLLARACVHGEYLTRHYGRTVDSSQASLPNVNKSESSPLSSRRSICV